MPAGRLLRIGACALWPSVVAAQAQDPAHLVAAYLERDGLPSLSVAVGRGGELLYAGAQGLADVENEVPATAETAYRIGSVSKVLTATAVLQLAESGRLDLDAPVQAYCAAFPEERRGVTPRLLLAHLGGVRHYDYQRFREEFLSDRRYGSLDEALGVFANDPLAAVPGETYLYSSFGYVLLGCAVEGASGLAYGDYVERKVTRVVGMEQTRLDVPEDIVAHRARCYSRSRDGALTNSPCVDLSDRYPAGGFLSTPRDLVAFGSALLRGKLLAEETWAAMRQRQATSRGEEVPCGLGWQLSDRPAELFHGGTSVGGSTYLYLDAETGTVVAIATNVDRWTEPRQELARALATWSEAR